jgi:hypothetical protein
MALVTISRWYLCFRLVGRLPGKEFAMACLVPVGLLTVWIGIRFQDRVPGASGSRI